MHNLEVKNYLIECWDEVKDVEKAVNALDVFDKQRNYLTKYILIRCCGTLELSYKTLFARYAGHSLCQRTENYIEDSVIGSSMNPSLYKIKNLANRFDDRWGKKLEATIENHKRKSRIRSSINSLVTLRNKFAHGQTAQASFTNVKSYFVEACRVLYILDQIIGKNTEDPHHNLVCDEFKKMLHSKLVDILKRNMRYRRIKDSGFKLVPR